CSFRFIKYLIIYSQSSENLISSNIVKYLSKNSHQYANKNIMNSANSITKKNRLLTIMNFLIDHRKQMKTFQIIQIRMTMANIWVLIAIFFFANFRDSK